MEEKKNVVAIIVAIIDYVKGKWEEKEESGRREEEEEERKRGEKDQEEVGVGMSEEQQGK
uniref:Uncharacterized protein n=1 Tax=Cucumis melo TaxID=3656 RepID=A0A9I9DR74_CUCME